MIQADGKEIVGSGAFLGCTALNGYTIDPPNKEIAPDAFTEAFGHINPPPALVHSSIWVSNDEVV